MNGFYPFQSKAPSSICDDPIPFQLGISSGRKEYKLIIR